MTKGSFAPASISRRRRSAWAHLVNGRHPLPLETSVPGVFAIGDARANSTKRVAAAVGEGAAVVAQVHALLASQSRPMAIAAPIGVDHAAL